jgi:protein involved in polysaccharide export with SLBB domain
VRNSITAALIIAFALACTSCSGPGGPPLPASIAQQSDYHLGPGDKIHVLVSGLDPMSNDYVVGDSGVISLPYVETVQASGRTLAEVQQDIQGKLAAKQILKNPIVNVEHVALRPFYVIGEVRNPGEYTFRPGTTVVSAVAMAGGFTYRAYQSKVKITRLVNGREVIGTASQNSPVMPGDRIIVAERWL